MRFKHKGLATLATFDFLFAIASINEGKNGFFGCAVLLAQHTVLTIQTHGIDYYFCRFFAKKCVVQA